jgi:preprotein translocase subunit Sec61beta
MAKKSGGRLVSSAGLVTYYDSEDKRAVRISPVAVLIIAAIIGILTYLINIFY